MPGASQGQGNVAEDADPNDQTKQPSILLPSGLGRSSHTTPPNETHVSPQLPLRCQQPFQFPVADDALSYRVAKRVFDVIVGSVAIVGLSPFMLVATLLVKLQDGGQVIFSQDRVGRGGRIFRCYKFRTMVIGAEAMQHAVSELNHHPDQRTFKTKRDPRVTPVGHVLRRLSIDEFPQLWNVLRGDMSLVGPRPPVPSEVEHYTDLDIQRLEVKPGLTCIWQISGRGDLPFDKQIVLDLEYIENRSFWFDLKLLLRTIPVLLTAKGAY